MTMMIASGYVLSTDTAVTLLAAEDGAAHVVSSVNRLLG
ncbi:Uncharacterised protein [Mycobacteroides abscessus]|nr:Uncharacterised protein [Mycobacteroides abscessus]